MADFPEHLFSLGGSPEAIAGSARRYDRFGESASHAAERITGMDTGQFQGPEAEQFREKIDSELPPDLRVTGTAFSQVGTALDTFSSRLSELQGKMRPLAHQAPGLWEQLKASEGRVERAQSADRAHTQAEQDRVAHAPAGQAPPPGPAYESDTGDASSALSSARAAWQDCVDKANGLRTEMTAAARECSNRINEAKGMRFKEPPAGYDLIGQGQDFIRENKDVLKEISSALKVVSGALAVVGLVLQAIPVVGNAVGGAFLIAAGITGGAALAIDAGIYAATGEGSLTSILVDTALTVIPFGRVAKLGGKLIGASGKLAGAAKSAAAGAGRLGRQLGAKAKSVMPWSKKTACLEPIDVDSGRMLLSQTDVELDGVLPLVLSRTHVSSHRHGLFFGPSWTSTLDQRLEIDDEGVYFASEDGLTVPYPHPEPGVPVLPVVGPQRPLERSDDGAYVLTDPDRGRTLRFAQYDAFWLLTSITDRNDNRIDFSYDDTGLPIEVRHSGGYRIRVETKERLVTGLYLRDAKHGVEVALMRYGYRDERLTEVINESGQPLRFDYDTAGQITGWTDRNGVQYRYTYDAEGRCVRTEGSDGFLSGTLTYDTDNGITYVTDSLGHRTAYHLNHSGQVIRQIDPLGAETVSEWDEFDLLLSRTDPLGRTTGYEYDETGNLTAVCRPDGGQLQIAYNELRQPVTMIAPDGAVSHREYDQRGNLVRTVDPAGAATSYAYDEHGQLVGITDALGNTRRVEANAAGLPTAVTDRLGATTRYERDVFGRVVAITDPVGGVTRLGWTVDGKPAWRTLPDGATERWLYDAEGNLHTHIDPLGQRTSTEVTHFDLPSAEVRPDGTRLAFGYDTELRLTSVTNEQGLVWRYDYDPVGNLVSETDFNDRTLSYRHDAAGQLIARTNGAGETTEFVRTALGEVAESRAGDTVAAFRYDAAGRLVEATNDDAHVVLERDRLGRLLTEAINGRSTTSTYDVLGRRTQRVTPSGAASSWEYDANGQPLVLQTADRTVRFHHDQAGRETSRELGADVVLRQAWDAGHHLTAQTLTRREQRQSHRAYTYRPDGVLASIDDQHAGSSTLDLDTVGRVTGVQAPGWTERYAYDAAGNVTSASWPAADTAPAADVRGERTYNGILVQRAGKIRYEYDAQGRVVLRQQKRLSQKPATWRYTWDADDRLTDVVTPDGTHWRYRYDALGRRVAKQRLNPDETQIVEQIDFAWDGALLAEQEHRDRADTPEDHDPRVTVWNYDPSGFRVLSQTERTPIRDAPQQWIDDQFFAVMTDLIGTPKELIDEDGSIVWTHKAPIWGNIPRSDHGGTSIPLRFPGQYADPETTFCYNGHRHYDPATGRYVSMDPLGLEAGPNPQRYVSNPYEWIDPLGLMSCNPGSGSITYGELDDLGRPTGVTAELTPDMAGTGSSAARSIKPPGFGGGAAGHARGHLLGNQLGGSGTDPRNLVTLFQNPANSPVMRGFENEVRAALDAGQNVSYTATPVYNGAQAIPLGVTLRAQGSGGLDFFVSIINRGL